VREAHHSPATSAEVKKTWMDTSTPPYFFMAYCFIKHRDDFTFIVEGCLNVLSCKSIGPLMKEVLKPGSRISRKREGP
jgi:hypothetical protein